MRGALTMTIGMIGAGSVGRALGGALTGAGHRVVYGVRELGRTGAPAPEAPAADVSARCDLLFVAVPAPEAVASLTGIGEGTGKTVVDCTNPLRWEDGPVWNPPSEGSVAAQLAKAYPRASVVKGFNHFGAEIQADPALAGGPADALFASDDPGAKAAVMALAEEIGFLPRDAGRLRNAALLENLAVTWIHLATVGGLGRQIGFRLEGR